MQSGVSSLHIHGKLLTILNASIHSALTAVAPLQRRPLDEKLVPVNMSDFIDHQKSHSFALPGCFCPALSGSSQNVESAIFVAPDEIYEKRYIAACSTHSCEYVGEYVDLMTWFINDTLNSEDVFPSEPSGTVLSSLWQEPFIRRHILITNFTFQPLRVKFFLGLSIYRLIFLNDKTWRTVLLCTLRENDGNISVCETFRGEDSSSADIPLDALRFATLFFPPSPPVDATTPALLYRLHSAHRPGLLEKDFHNLFVRCECGMVSTTRKNPFHRCQTSLSARHSQDVSLLGEGDFLRLLYRLDAGVRLEDFAQMFARCTCGLVMTKRRFAIHECLRIP